MRFSRPGTGTILGAIALFVALGGTALATGATVVNIADPTTPTRIAHVSASGQLQTTGTVTNAVTTQLTAPANYLHSTTFALTSSRGCVTVATPPTGKAMIVREVRVDAFSVTSPGPLENVAIYAGIGCSGSQVADVNPSTVGETVLPFDPGLGIPANSGLSAFVNGSVQAEVYTDGYAVGSTLVPSSAITTTGTKASRHQ